MATKYNMNYILERSNFGAFRQSMEYFKQHHRRSAQVYLDDSAASSLGKAHTDEEKSQDRSNDNSSNDFFSDVTARDLSQITRSATEVSLSFETTESHGFSDSNYSDPSFSNEVTLVGIDPNFSLDLRRDLAAITKKVEVFSKPRECLEFIKNCEMKSVFLVWLDAWSKRIESHISTYHQIICIYVLPQQSSQFPFSWEENYEKELLIESPIWGVTTTDETHFLPGITDNDYIPERSIEGNAGPVNIFGTRAYMLDQVKRDVLLWHNNQTSWYFASAENSEREQQFSQDISADYSWYRILTDVVLSMPIDCDHPYAEMLYLCRLIYKNQNNETQLKKIDEFERLYDATNALWWYSGQTFLYFVLNRALRTANIDIIFKFRPIIQDIHRHLKCLQAKQTHRPITLYRGHLVTYAELSRLKKSVGKVISFFGFTSTTRDRDIAVVFSGGGDARPRLESLIYEIIIPEEDTSQCVYADIADVSQISNEYETLFSFNSTFRIVEVREEPNFTVIKLVVANDNYELRKLVEDNVESGMANNRDFNNLVGSANELMLADRLSDKGDFEQALLYYRTSQDCYLSEDSLAMLHNNSGWLFERRGQYSAALDEYQKALNFHKRLMDQNPLRQAIIYTNIGLIHYELENSDAAKYNLTYSLKLKREATEPAAEPSSIAKTLNSLALVDHKLGKYNPALDTYEEALRELHKSKMETKPLEATILSNIGHVKIGINDYPSAIEKFEETLKIRTQLLPSTHPDIAWGHVQVGLVFERIGDYFRADEHYKTAGDIQIKNLPTNHPDLANTYTRQGSIKSMYGSTMDAIEFYDKALKIYNNMFPYKKAEIATIYNNRGRVYKQMDDIPRARKDYETALRLFLECRRPDHPSLKRIYGNLAELQHSQDEYEKALKNYNIAIQIGRNTLHIDDPELQKYQALADLARLNIPNAPALPIPHPNVVRRIRDIINNCPPIWIWIIIAVLLMNSVFMLVIIVYLYQNQRDT